MIFANHAHVFSKEIRPEGTVEKLIELMNECGIDMAVCYPPFHDRYREAGFTDDPNEWLAEEIKDNKRLIGFGNIDFERGNLKQQVYRIAALGFKGIKLSTVLKLLRSMKRHRKKVFLFLSIRVCIGTDSEITELSFSMKLPGTFRN